MADIAKKQNNAKKPVGITETILRDAHQSLIATRMTTEQMLPIVEKMDQVGYHSVECWGGELPQCVGAYPGDYQAVRGKERGAGA